MGAVAFMLPRTSTGRQGPRHAPPLLAALPPVSETPCHTAWVHNAESSLCSVQKSLLSWAAQAHCCSAPDPARGSRRHHHTHPLYVVVLWIDGRAELSGPLVRCVRGGGTVVSLCAQLGTYREERAIDRPPTHANFLKIFFVELRVQTGAIMEMPRTREW